jgi:hypothetical protein
LEQKQQNNNNRGLSDIGLSLRLLTLNCAMYHRRLAIVARNACRTSKINIRQNATGAYRPLTAADDADQVFRMNEEGDIWDHNFSLTEDGVINAGRAYRNARVQILANRIKATNDKGKSTVSNVDYVGNFNLLEAGDSIPLNSFETALESHQDSLSQGQDLFFEDTGLGAASSLRVGARVISDNASHAFIFRSLLVNS